MIIPFHIIEILFPIRMPMRNINLTSFNLSMLFCKPSRKTCIVYEQAIGKGQTLSFRSLNPKHDLRVIQHWISFSSWNEFWDLPKTHQHPVDIYQLVQKKSDTHALVGLLDEQLICQIDLCLATVSDLGKHIRVSGKDCVARFLFNSPPIAQQVVIAAFLVWYFQFPGAGRLYAIPGIQHHSYCRMLELSGFIFHQNCILTHEAVSIYQLNNKIFSRCLS